MTQNIIQTCTDKGSFGCLCWFCRLAKNGGMARVIYVILRLFNLRGMLWNQLILQCVSRK